MEEDQKKIVSFKAATTKDWEAAAREELDGADPWEKLTHQGHGWSIKPFYTRKQAAQRQLLHSEKQNNFLGARTWHNCPHLLVNDQKKANETALTCLQQGADGIFFELETEVDFNILLKKIEWEYCSLSFFVKNNPEGIAQDLLRFAEGKKIPATGFHGAFFGNALIPALKFAGFHSCGVRIPTAGSPVEEIASAFKSLSAMTGANLASLAGGAAVSFSVGSNFFLEIARLRAVRVLWTKYAEAAGIKEPPLLIHALSTPMGRKEFQPHGNMLSSTTNALAAILGGCNVLIVQPEDPAQPLMSRVALNVSTILREESHLSRVADPIAGSWFLDDLTSQLVEAALPLVRDLFHS